MKFVGGCYALNTEKSLLAAIIHKPKIRSLIFYKVNSDFFFDPQHCRIFGETKTLFNQNPEFDNSILFDRLKDSKLISFIENELTNKTFIIKNIDLYINELKEKTLLRKAFRYAENFCQRVESDKEIKPEKISALAAKLIELFQNEIEDISINNLIEEFQEEYEKQKESKSKIIGFPTGIEKLDTITMGIKPGEITIIGGQTSIGKTTLGLNLTLSAIQNNIPSLIITLEMKKTAVMQRLLSSISGIPLLAIKLSKLSKKEEETINAILSNFRQRNALFITDKLLTLDQILNLIRLSYLQNKVRFVLLDYIQYVPNMNDRNDIKNLTRSLSHLSKELDIAVVANSQLSRYIERREGDSRPRLSDLRESGSLEEDCGMVTLLHAPYRRTKKESEINDLYVYVEKNRNGPIGDIKLYFNKENQRITDAVSPGRNIFNELIEEIIQGEPAGII